MTPSLLRGGLLLTGGEAVSKLLSFVRNVVIARLVSPEDFGIAATLAITISFIELVSDLALDRFVIQAKDGDDPRLQRAAQLVLAVRGLLGGLALFVLAAPVAGLFSVPEAEWAFRWVATVPLLKGLIHLDRMRLQRGMRFGLFVATETAGQAVAIVVAYLVARATGDYSAMLWAVVAQFSVTALTSHVLAPTRYRWAWDGDYLRRMSRFALPLVVNGLMIFATLQGDRLVIATYYSNAELGVYSVAFGLAMMPALMLAKVNSSLTLPLLARVQGEPREFAGMVDVCSTVLALISGAMLSFFIIWGGPAIALVYGEAYAGGAAVIAWVAAMHAVRLVRAAPSQAALARGDTLNTMLANIGRVLALPAMFGLALAGVELWVIAACGLGGESLALIIASLRLRSRHGVPLRAVLRGVTILFAPAVAVTGYLVMGTGELSGRGAAFISMLTAGALAVAAWVILRNQPWRRVLSRAVPSGDDTVLRPAVPLPE